VTYLKFTFGSDAGGAARPINEWRHRTAQPHYAGAMATTGKVLRAASRATSRRAQYSASTRKALVRSATKLFAERGYAGTSLDEVVARARVTKGALYHHYQGKQALFEAVFDQVEQKAQATIAKRIAKVRDPWERALEGLRGYLEVCEDPTYRRIVIQEGPVRLGFDRWREAEERMTYGLMSDIVRGLLADFDAPDRVVETFSQIFFGAVSSAGLWVADSDDPEQTSRDVEVVIGAVLSGLRTLADTGVDIFDPGRTED
jgi:AcrR family transcriptional regulator